MSESRWGDLPEARQLASLGKKLSRAAQGRLQWMLFYYFNGRNAARTCRRFGISRQTFYRWLRRLDRHDLRTLEERSHRPRNIRQPTWTAAVAERAWRCANNIRARVRTSWWCCSLAKNCSFPFRWSDAFCPLLSVVSCCTNPQSPPS